MRASPSFPPESLSRPLSGAVCFRSAACESKDPSHEKTHVLSAFGRHGGVRQRWRVAHSRRGEARLSLLVAVLSRAATGVRSVLARAQPVALTRIVKRSPFPSCLG